MLKEYYLLTKPGIIRGNIITATAGFLLASGRHINLLLAFFTLTGLSLIIASACVSNNYIDRLIDKKMARTANRALAEGRITKRAALTYAAVLGALGGGLLITFVSWLAFLLSAVGFVAYVFIYGHFKRRSTLGTAIGSISGAIPPAVGYVAVSGHINIAAVLLFIILVFWQMPHFFAIAMYRLADYTAAGLPVLPIKKGLLTTKVQSIVYIFAYALASVSLSLLGYTGRSYLIVMIIVSALWLGQAIAGLRTPNTTAWAHQFFYASLAVITIQCLLIGLNAFLP